MTPNNKPGKEVFVSSKIPKILAIIPCYNEAGSIGSLLQEFSALNFPCDTLVIDDGSADETYAIVSQHSQVIRFETNRGLSAAIRTGIHFALENGYDYCIQIDGDGQHPPEEIAHFIARLTDMPANLIIGSRYYQKPFTATGGLRRIAGFLFACVLGMLFGKWIYDPLSGMRMMDRTAMQYFAEHLNTAHPDTAILSQALKHSFSVTEILVTMRPRATGISYVVGLKGMKFFLRLVVITFRIKCCP